MKNTVIQIIALIPGLLTEQPQAVLGIIIKSYLNT